MTEQCWTAPGLVAVPEPVGEPGGDRLARQPRPFPPGYPRGWRGMLQGTLQDDAGGRIADTPAIRGHDRQPRRTILIRRFCNRLNDLRQFQCRRRTEGAAAQIAPSRRRVLVDDGVAPPTTFDGDRHVTVPPASWNNAR